jgi:hypothetical protein
MLKYALRYAPLLVLALLLIPLRLSGWGEQQPASRQRSLSPFQPGSELFGITMRTSADAWAVGGIYTRSCSTENTFACNAVPYRGDDPPLWRQDLDGGSAEERYILSAVRGVPGLSPRWLGRRL